MGINLFTCLIKVQIYCCRNCNFVITYVLFSKENILLLYTVSIWKIFIMSNTFKCI